MHLLRFAAFCALFLLTAVATAEAAEKPNIIFVMADDLGYGDLGSFGQQKIATPNLDEMARQGMRMTDFYAGCTVCAPSRCVLMTGLHTGHCFIRGNAKDNLRPSDVTVAEVLKKAGYQTALIGKWGLGHEGSTGVPTRQGFDYFFGYLDQTHAHNYYPTFLMRNEERVPLKNVPLKEGPWGQGIAKEKVDYSHDLCFDEAMQWIDGAAKKDAPFFLYLSLTIPHANNEAGKAGMEVPEYGQYADKDWPEPQKGHAAMISRMDRDLGKLFAKLKADGIDDNTLVIFTSDNGPHREGGNDPDFADSNGPLQGIKRSLHEGGIRVPTIVRWPGHVKAGSQSDWAGAFWDVMPTLAAVAGVTDEVPSDIDGVSFLPTITGKGAQKEHDYLYWAFYERGGAQAVRQGDWKAIQQPINTPVRLYNLKDDLGEEHNLAADHPEKVAEMTKMMAAAYSPSDSWKFPQPKPKKNNAKGKN
ncbi:arylsulfatase [Blastopirellula retiformator]|uniref:Arylsulfatase n=1 Tax=Blastopirellula retiformator TaxID=2527970 RepID=A0A5C5UYQ7_9BACT|nr:arylsulfatase [Blastopirellula retiformator]TWT31506.1 Arylsulfatase [Blastopirellula retiformator]